MKTKILNRAKKVLLLLAILFAAYNLEAQTPIQNIEFNWHACFDNELFASNRVPVAPRGVLAIEDGYLMLADQNYSKLWLIKTNLQGEEQWSKFIYEIGYGEKMVSFLPSETPDRHYIISPLSLNTPLNECQGLQSILITKTDDKGDIIWNTCFYKDSDLYLNGAFSINDGIVLMVMAISESKTNYIVKLNHEGDLLWELALPEDFSDQHVFDNGFISTSDGGILLSGDEKNGTKAYIIKLNAQGEQEWQRRYGGIGYHGNSPCYSYICNFIETEEGYFAVGASNAVDGDLTGLNYHTGSNNLLEPSSDVWVLKLDFSGNILWHQLYGGARTSIGFRVFETTDKNLLVFACTGAIDGDVNPLIEGSYNMAMWMFRLHANDGSLLSQRVITNGGADLFVLNGGASIIQMSDETYVMAAAFDCIGNDVVCRQGYSPEGLQEKIWLTQITLKDSGDNGSMNETNTLQAAVYPNPATNHVLVECAEYENAEFAIYDLVGRMLYRQLLSSEKSYINTATLKNGLYVYHIQSKDKKRTEKLAITR